ncbi:MAG TPA: hypothetical protein PLB89_05035 [Flavobacteriales bacterium]|nr:hypothetical protein [Flavobacteriales bacterium]
MPRAKTPLLRIDELTAPPVVGRTYLVPHVFQLTYPSDTRVGNWVPVRGAVHDDAELGVLRKHLHFDERFVSKAMMKRIGIENAHSWIVVIGQRDSSMRWSDGKVEWRPARCVTNVVGFANAGRTKAFFRFHQEYRDKELLKGHICPHRGYDLSTIPANAEGVKVCPLHGLHWCAKTGKNVQRKHIIPLDL